MKSIQQFLLYFFAMLLVISCSEAPELDISKDITIDEVQTKFNSTIPSSSDGRQGGKMGINWKLGVYRKISLGDALVFPINNVENLYVSGSMTAKRFAIEFTSYAFAYKLDGEVQLKLVQPVPTNNDALFTGFVTVRNWGGKVEHVFVYEKGEFLYERSNDDNTENSSGRVSGLVCTTTYTWWVSTSEDGSEIYDITLDDTDIICNYESGPENVIVPPDGPSNGGENKVTCPSGYILIGDTCIEKLIIPCPGNPLANMEVAHQLVSGIEGGKHGCTRGGLGCGGDPAKKTHIGIDLKSEYGDPIFAMYNGVATQFTQYDKSGKISGAGHFINIVSTITGKQVTIGYFHMQKNGRATGKVQAGDIIGFQGRSGNLGKALDGNTTVSHLHIKVREGTSPVDPIEYFGTPVEEGEETPICNQN